MSNLYGVNFHLDRVYGSGTPPIFYIAAMQNPPYYLSTGASLDEPVGHGYARVVVPNDVANWPPAADGLKGNGKPIIFPKATGTWGNMKYWAICDAATDGNMIRWGRMTSRLIVINSTLRFPVDQLTITVR